MPARLEIAGRRLARHTRVAPQNARPRDSPCSGFPRPLRRDPRRGGGERKQRRRGTPRNINTRVRRRVARERVRVHVRARVRASGLVRSYGHSLVSPRGSLSLTLRVTARGAIRPVLPSPRAYRARGKIVLSRARVEARASLLSHVPVEKIA